MPLYNNSNADAQNLSEESTGKGSEPKPTIDPLSLPFWYADESLSSVMECAKEGLLSLCTAVGLQVVEKMMDQELDAKIGPKGKHNPDRQATRMATKMVQLYLEDAGIP